MTTLTDPVCGAPIVCENAAGVVLYDGRLHYFCCSKCRKRFLHAPRRYGNPEHCGCERMCGTYQVP